MKHYLLRAGRKGEQDEKNYVSKHGNSFIRVFVLVGQLQ